MSKSMKRSRPKETEESPKKSKSSNHGQEQIDVTRHDHDNQGWFPNSGYFQENHVPFMELDENSTYPLTGSGAVERYSFNSHSSLPENTLEDVLPMDVLDEDSCEMDLDKNSPDPISHRPFAEQHQNRTIKIGKEKSSPDSILQPTCALLNSGGGLLEIKIYNYSEFESPLKEFDKFWQGIEEKLEAMIEPSSYAKVFDRIVKQDEVFLFIKAPDHWCTLEPNLYFSGDSKVSIPSYSETVELLVDKPFGKKKRHSYCKVRLDQLPTLPKTFRYKGKLDFHESKQMQFKYYKSKNPIWHNNSQDAQDRILRQISAFANGSGGIILVGVEDDCTVRGQNLDSEGNSKEELEQRLDSLVDKMEWGFTPERKLHWDVKFFPVQGKEGCFVIAIYVAGIKGGVFAKCPKSYELRRGDQTIYEVKFQEWKQRMLRGRHILQNESQALKYLTEKFNALSTSSGVLLTVKGSVGRIRDSFFTVKAGCPVSPKGFETNLPESAQVVIKQIQEISSKGRGRALLVASRSWLSCIKNDDGERLPADGVICDLLLFNVELGGLHLFTLCDSEQEEQVRSYSHTTAKALKKALVTDGDCHEKFYITNHVVPCRSPSMQISQPSPDYRYPMEYQLGSSRGKVNKILDSVVKILAVVPSTLSSKQGISFLNLLTKEQFQLVYQEIKRSRELWIKGAAGTGKTLVAVEFMKELCHRDPSLRKYEILYVCENRGLVKQISKHDVCRCVCRKTFMMRSDLTEVKHIIMDEVQSFTDEDRNKEHGDSWLQKARKLVRQHSVDDPGFLWLFVDNKQINHGHPTGIPDEKDQTPSFTLTKVIRNSHRIFKYAARNIFSKEATGEIEIGHDFEGENIVGKRYSKNEASQISVLKTVLGSLSSEGYSQGDIAILYGKENCIPASLRDKLSPEVTVDAEKNDSEYLVISTLRKYSGLERPVVILVNVEDSLPFGSNKNSAFYCCATRAMVKLVILRPKS